MSNKLGAEVNVGSVDIDFFTKLVLNDLYVEDEQEDTLITIQQLTADFNVFSFGDKYFDASSIDLYNANLRMKRRKGETHSNLKFITDYLKSTKPDSLKEAWDFEIENISLHHCAYSLVNENDTIGSKSKLNFKNLSLQNINGQIKDFHIEEDTTFVTLTNLAFDDHSGFSVNGLSANTVFSSEKMEFSNLNLVTDETNLNGYLKLSYDSLPDFKNFEENVRINSEFENSKIASSDLAYFIPGLEGLNKNISLSGKIRGRITSLKGRDLDIRYSRSTRFAGNISLNGLPDFEETFIDLVVKNFQTTRNDLVSIPKPPFTTNEYLKIPENVAALGNIRFAGKFTGFPSDFVAYGNLESDLGNLESDLNLKLDNNNIPSYSGKLIADNFDFGTYYGIGDKLGKSSFESKIEGKGIELEDLDAKFDGIIQSMELNNYTYENVYADGNLAKGLFNGALKVDEKNLSIDFDGAIDFTGDLPVYNFEAKINKANLTQLKVFKRDSSANLVANADIKFSGDNLENIQGLIQLKDVRYIEKNDTINIEYVTLVAVDDSNKKSINIYSDLMDASVDGTFELNTIGKSVKSLVGSYFPVLLEEDSTEQPLQAMDFEFDLKKTDDLFNVFLPGISVSEDTQLEGSLNTKTNDLNFHLVSQKIINKKFQFDNIDVQGSTKQGKLDLYSEIGRLYGRDSLLFTAGKVFASTTRDSAAINLKLGESKPIDSYLDLYSVVKYNKNGGTSVSLLPSNIMKFNERWSINRNNEILFADNKVRFENVIFFSKKHALQLDGVLSESADDVLDVKLKDFHLQVLNNALKMYRIQAGGVANGTVHLAALSSKPVVTTDLTIKDLSIFNDTLGDAEINSFYINNEKSIKVDAAISRGGEKNITLNGKYFIKKPHDMVDATIIAKRVHLSTLGKYIEAVASNVTGLVSGKARLTGELLSPSIDGIARIQKASFLVDYLNTSYNFTSDLALIDDHIELKDVVLNDEDGRQAMVNGKVLHNNLGGLSFDVNINADEVKCLNTKLSQNELYYGKAYGSGTVDITGDVDLLKMDIAMKSERGTQINIPLSNPDEISSTNFITFINTRSMRENIKDKAIDLSGLEMNFELEVTRDADIQLIFDEKIGDVIRGTGNGNLIMEIDRVGNFNMFGDYQVHDGKYDFTLQNIIDKKFRMVQGGTIRWNGDPYEAIVNLEAIYRTKANIKDLIPDALTDDDTTSSVSSTKRVPVNLHLLITERLLNPEIKMEIKFPDIDPGIESLVYRYVDTEQEVNEQAFSLLILNRFATPDEFANTATESSGAAVSANLSEFASNQLSAWASKISPDLDIGFNYQAKDAISEEELEIYFGTRFINDRILLNGNFDVTGQENTNDIVGDFELEVLLGKEGRFRVKAFNKANNNTLLDNFESDYTQGIGLFYRKEFNKLSEAFKSNKKIKAQQNKQENQTNDGTSSNQ